MRRQGWGSALCGRRPRRWLLSRRARPGQNHGYVGSGRRTPQFGSPLSGIGWCIRHNGCPALCDTSSADDEHATRTPLLSEKHPISHYLEMSDGLYVAAVGPRRSTTGRGSLIGGAGRLGAVIGGPKGLIAQLLLEHHEG